MPPFGWAPLLPVALETFHDRSPVLYQRTLCFQPLGGDPPHRLQLEIFAWTLTALDKEHDGTLDIAEAKDAAAIVFDKLDKDSDATLDSKEIGGRAARHSSTRPTRSRRNLD